MFDALLENMICGVTSYPKTSFESEYTKLTKVDGKTGKSGLMKQFEVGECYVIMYFRVNPSCLQMSIRPLLKTTL